MPSYTSYIYLYDSYRLAAPSGLGELPRVRQPRGVMAALHGGAWRHSGLGETQHLDPGASRQLSLQRPFTEPI